MTHLDSGWEKLAQKLESKERFHVFNTGRSYHHPDDVNLLTNELHRCDNSAAVWVDLIFHNKDFTMRRLLEYYPMVFWSDSIAPCRHLANRLAGMKIYWKRKPGSLWNPSLEDDLLFETILRWEHGIIASEFSAFPHICSVKFPAFAFLDIGNSYMWVIDAVLVAILHVLG